MPESAMPETSPDASSPVAPVIPSRGAESPTGNRRLTAMLGVTLNSLLLVQILTALFFGLLAVNVVLPSGPIYAVVRPLHFFVGFLLIPLAGLKILSTLYRFTRYYTRNTAYHDAGPPHPVARMVTPLLIGSLVLLIFSGIMMWSFANWFGIPWIPVHVITAIAFTVLLAVHLWLHIREAHREAALEAAAVAPAPDDLEATEQWRRGVMTRRAILATGLGAGAVLAVSASQTPAVALSWLAPRRAGQAALDFPIMNYEGGQQQVDVARWRLNVSGDVATPLSLSYADIMAMPMEEHEYDLNCVTGWMASRRWRGVSLARVLALSSPSADFGNILVRSTSGYHWSHSRSNALLAGSLLVTHVNDEQLNDDHGYPVRLLIPGTVGQANVKWVDGIIVGMGAPEMYFSPNFVFDPSLPVSGRLLPSNPAGHRG